MSVRRNALTGGPAFAQSFRLFAQLVFDTDIIYAHHRDGETREITVSHADYDGFTGFTHLLTRKKALTDDSFPAIPPRKRSFLVQRQDGPGHEAGSLSGPRPGGGRSPHGRLGPQRPRGGSMSEPLFSLNDVHYDYRLSGRVVRALQGVTLDIPREQVVCLSGPSGSGKSALLNLMGLLDVPRSGTVRFDGADVTRVKEAEKERLPLHRLGFVFQAFNLFPTLTTAENVEHFLLKQSVSRRERLQRVGDALRAVGVLDQRDKRPDRMSGGQRQRVAIARTLAKRPDVILADEPTASLDQRNGRDVMALFKELTRRYGLAVVIASHDPMVFAQADRNVRLEDGRLKEGQ